MNASTTVVFRARTRRWETVVTKDGDAHRWTRHTVDPHHQNASLPWAVAAWLQDASVPRTAFVVPTDLADSRVEWRVRGHRPLAAALHPDPRRRPAELDVPAAVAMAAELGHALARAHSGSPGTGSVPDTLASRPFGTTRLRAWSSGEWQVGAAAADRRALARIVGPALFATVDQLIDDLVREATGPATRLVHGWFSLGSMIVDPARPQVCDILSGPDVTLGTSADDLGFLLGELFEFFQIARRSGRPGLEYVAMARAALEAAAHPQDDSLARALAARVVLHVVDFSSFVGPNPELSRYGEIIRIATQEPFAWLRSRGPSPMPGRRACSLGEQPPRPAGSSYLSRPLLSFTCSDAAYRAFRPGDSGIWDL